MAPGSETPPAVGQIRRHAMLDSEALYRVAALAGEQVTLEVISAPGLTPGYRFAVTREAAARMPLQPAAGETA